MSSANIEFNNQLVPQCLLEIEQLGQCAIEATSDDGYYFYLIIKTSLGTSTIASCGPVVPDVTFLPNGFNTTLTRIKYKEEKVSFEIAKWLNDKSKKITEARCITEEEAINQFRDLGDYIRNYSDEVY